MRKLAFLMLLLRACVAIKTPVWGALQSPKLTRLLEPASAFQWQKWKPWLGHACNGWAPSCGDFEYHLCDHVIITIDECKRLCVAEPTCDGVTVRTQEQPKGMAEPPGFCRLQDSTRHKTTPSNNPWQIRGWDCHMLSGRSNETAVAGNSESKARSKADIAENLQQRLKQLKALKEFAPLVVTEGKYERAKKLLLSLPH
jgi:hypothetical protein